MGQDWPGVCPQEWLSRAAQGQHPWLFLWGNAREPDQLTAETSLSAVIPRMAVTLSFPRTGQRSWRWVP